MAFTRLKFLFAASICLSSAAQAQTAVDLNDWTAESYPAVSGFGAGIWTPTPSGSSVTQSVNGQPTIFYSDFDAYGTQVTGTIRPGSGDDDYIGFVIGFQPLDSIDTLADYLLIDWKQGTQFFNFGAPADSTPGGTAFAGLAVSRVTGIPTADEFWQHTDYAANPSGGLVELQRGATLGATGWTDNTDYDFTFDFGPNNLQVFVNDNLELDITGNYSNGRLGFYNFSQANVVYSAFTTQQGSFQGGVPEPSTWAMMLLGFFGIGGMVRAQQRRQRLAVSCA